MATRRTRREYFGDNLWREVPLAMDAALEEDEDDQDERDHEAAMRVALDAYRDHREATDRKRGQDRRRGRDSDDPMPAIERSGRPEHQPPGSRSERSLIAGDSARRRDTDAAAARDAFPSLSRLRM